VIPIANAGIGRQSRCSNSFALQPKRPRYNATAFGTWTLQAEAMNRGVGLSRKAIHCRDSPKCGGWPHWQGKRRRLHGPGRQRERISRPDIRHGRRSTDMYRFQPDAGMREKGRLGSVHQSAVDGEVRQGTVVRPLWDGACEGRAGLDDPPGGHGSGRRWCEESLAQLRLSEAVIFQGQSIRVDEMTIGLKRYVHAISPLRRRDTVAFGRRAYAVPDKNVSAVHGFARGERRRAGSRGHSDLREGTRSPPRLGRKPR